MNEAGLLAALCASVFLGVGLSYRAFCDHFSDSEPVPVRRRTRPPHAGPALTRRGFGRAAAGLVVAAVGAALGATRAFADDSRLATEVPANETTVKAVGYVNQSAKAGQQCKNCLLYQPGAAGRGKCALFAQGQVSEQGWCSSWVAKPS
jgi:hypothetical protein